MLVLNRSSNDTPAEEAWFGTFMPSSERNPNRCAPSKPDMCQHSASCQSNGASSHPETDPFVEEATAAFRAALGGRKPTGPFTVIFHGIVDNERDGPIEAMQGCPEDLFPNEVVGIRTEPAHDEAYTTITKARYRQNDRYFVSWYSFIAFQ